MLVQVQVLYWCCGGTGAVLGLCCHYNYERRLAPRGPLQGRSRAQCIGPSEKKGRHRATGSLKNKNKISDVGDAHKSQGGVSLGQGGAGCSEIRAGPSGPR